MNEKVCKKKIDIDDLSHPLIQFAIRFVEAEKELLLFEGNNGNMISDEWASLYDKATRYKEILQNILKTSLV